MRLSTSQPSCATRPAEFVPVRRAAIFVTIQIPFEMKLPSRVPLQRVLDICDPRKNWPWDCRPPSADVLHHLLCHAEEVARPVEGDATTEQHIGRIRYLAKHGWCDPIEIDMGAPCLGYPGPEWPVMDGNHRLWAATLRGDFFIEADIAGQVDHAAQLLGVPECEITCDRSEHAG